MKRISITTAILLMGGFLQTGASMADEFKSIPEIKDSLIGGEAVFRCTKANPLAPDTFKYAKNIIGSEALYFRKDSKWIEAKGAKSSGRYVSLPFYEHILYEHILGQMMQEKVQFGDNSARVVKGIDNTEYSAEGVIKRLSQDTIVLTGEVEYSFDIENLLYTKKNVKDISFPVKISESRYVDSEQYVGHISRLPVNKSLVEARKELVEKGKAYKSLPWKFTVPAMGSTESKHPDYLKAKKDYDNALIEYEKQKKAQEERERLNEERLEKNKALARQKYYTDGYDKLDVDLLLPADTTFYSGKCMYVLEE